MTIKSYNDLDTLAKDINEPELNQAEVEEILRCMDGSQMTPNGWKGSSQINTFGQAIDGNKRNHTTAHRNAKFRADAKDQAETDEKLTAMEQSFETLPIRKMSIPRSDQKDKIITYSGPSFCYFRNRKPKRL